MAEATRVQAGPGFAPGSASGSVGVDRVRVPGFLREVAIVVVGYAAYTWIRRIKRGETTSAFGHADWLNRLQGHLSLDVERSVNGFFSAHRVLATVSGYYYATLHFVVTIGVLVWLHRRHPERYRVARTGLVLCNYLALIVFYAWPLAPPRLASSGYDDIVKTAHVWGDLATSHVASAADQYAAMPSLHTAWALWSGLAIALCARRRWVRLLGVAYPVVTVLVIVGTANHYLLDAVAGASLMLLCLQLSPRVVGLLDRGHALVLTTWTSLRGAGRG